MSLPIGWGENRLEELSDKISDGLHSTPTYTEDSDIYFVNGNNIKDGRLCIFDGTKKVPESEWIRHKKDLGHGTILLSINGTIGSLAFYRGEKVVLGKSAAYINVKQDVSKEYVYYVLDSSQTKSYFDSELTGSTIKNLSLKAIKNLPIPVPPIIEQEKIAQILSTWDKAIEQLERYLLKKTKMNQLICDKLYLQVAKGHEQKKLKDICLKIQDGTHSTPTYTETGLPFYSVETVVSDDFKNTKCISEEDHVAAIKRCKLEKGDILLTRIGSLGVSRYIDWQVNASIYVSLALVKPNHEIVEGRFLYFYFKTSFFKKDLLKRSLLNAAPQKINLSEIGEIPVSLPMGKAVQEKCGLLGLSLERELKILNKVLSNYRLQKQGLMQKLLTGKVRVKV